MPNSLLYNYEAVPSDPEIPKEVFDYLRKKQAQREMLRAAGIDIPLVNPVIFNNEKIWAFGSHVYRSKTVNETFHQFLIGMLRQTLGKDWLSSQLQKPDEAQHFIAACFRHADEWVRRNQPIAQRVRDGKVWSATPDGYTKSLLVLAWDVCSVLHFAEIPTELLTRLRSQDHYQGARHEIMAAAIFSRLLYKVEWLEPSKKDKHCEFIATHNATGHSVAVETKSKHRPGVIHHPGAPKDSPAEMKRIFKEALEQRHPDTPFAVFIDVNLPSTPDVHHENKTWVQEVKRVVEKSLKGKNPADYPFDSAFFTNFSYHYQTANNAGAGETMSIIPDPNLEKALRELFERIHGALHHYGFVPPIDTEEGTLGSASN